MASRLTSLLELTSEQAGVAEQSSGKLKSLAEWFLESSEALKDTPLASLLGTATDAAREWSGTIRVLSKLLGEATKERSAQTLGWLACTLAYREAAEESVRQFGAPSSHFPFSGQLIGPRLAKLRLEDPSIMTGFSLENSIGHPFIRAADQALLLMVIIYLTDCALLGKVVKT
jgi:hypothetical protein